jgi:hypothetical protein
VTYAAYHPRTAKTSKLQQLRRALPTPLCADTSKVLDKGTGEALIRNLELAKNERTTALPTYPISLYSFFLYSCSSSVLPSSSFHPLGIDLSPRIHLYLDSSFSSLLSTRVQSDENKNQPTNQHERHEMEEEVVTMR